MRLAVRFGCRVKQPRQAPRRFAVQTLRFARQRSCHAERSEASGQPGHRGRPCRAMHVVRTRVASATFARQILRLRPQDDTGRGPSVHGPSHPVPKSCHAEQREASGQPRHRGSCHAERSEASGLLGRTGRPCRAMHVARARVASATFARQILRPAASATAGIKQVVTLSAAKGLWS